MSENEEKDKEQNNYDLKHSDKENENGIKLHFFEKAERDLHKVEEVLQKIERMREQLRTKIMQLQQDMVSKNNDTKAPAIKDGSEKVANIAPEKEPDMTQQDLMFCEKALEESNIIEAKSNQDKLVLSDILSKKEEKSYSVIVDIALKPLPSERNKNNNKDKDKDNKGNDDKTNKNQNKNADLSKLPSSDNLHNADMTKNMNHYKGDDNGDNNPPAPPGAAAMKKPTRAEIKAMRNGKPLQQQRVNPPSVVLMESPLNNPQETQNNTNQTVSKKEGLRNLRMGRSYGDSNEATQTRQTTLDRTKIQEINRSY